MVLLVAQPHSQCSGQFPVVFWWLSCTSNVQASFQWSFLLGQFPVAIRGQFPVVLKMKKKYKQTFVSHMSIILLLLIFCAYFYHRLPGGDSAVARREQHLRPPERARAYGRATSMVVQLYFTIKHLEQKVAWSSVPKTGDPKSIIIIEKNK